MKSVIKLLSGDSIQADVSKIGLLAIHKPTVGEAGGFVISHIPSGQVVTWRRLKRDATELRKYLESLDWSDLQVVESCLNSLPDPGSQ